MGLLANPHWITPQPLPDMDKKCKLVHASEDTMLWAQAEDTEQYRCQKKP